MTEEDKLTRLSGPLGLYVHVPFCEAKCRYCDFASWVDTGNQEERWIAAMERELALRAQALQGHPLDTIFIGGGTPTALSPRTLERLGRAIAAFPRKSSCEWSSEANPGSLTEEKLGILKDCGVNRLSMGVQSLDDALLKRMAAPTTRARLATPASCWNARACVGTPT